MLNELDSGTPITRANVYFSSHMDSQRILLFVEGGSRKQRQALEVGLRKISPSLEVDFEEPKPGLNSNNRDWWRWHCPAGWLADGCYSVEVPLYVQLFVFEVIDGIGKVLRKAGIAYVRTEVWAPMDC